MLCVPIITALTCIQSSGIHKKACGCPPVSGAMTLDTGTDHCHSAAHPFMKNNPKLNNNIPSLFITYCFILLNNSLFTSNKTDT